MIYFRSQLSASAALLVLIIATLTPSMQIRAAENNLPIDIELMRLYVGNEAVEPSSIDERNTQPLYQAHQLYLGRLERPLTIEFGNFAQSRTLAQDTNYRFRIAQLHEDWLYRDASSPLATYPNLPAGTYQFEVQARMNQEPWGHSQTIQLEVDSPLWLSYWALISYTVLIIAAIVSLVRIIRDRRLASYHLRTSEERLKLSLWGSGDQLWDWDIQQGQVHRHNTWQHFNEFPLDGARAGVKDAPSNIHPNDLSKVRDQLRQHLDGHSTHYEITYRVRSQAGWIWLLDRGKVVDRNEAGQALRMTGTLKDVSAMVAAEERLKMLAASITNISDGVCIYDHHFKVIETNQSFQRITGYSRGEMLGKPLKFPLYNLEFVEQIKRQLAHYGSWHGEVEDLRKDKNTYQMELTMDAVRDDQGHISHYVASFSDITDRKQSERELRRLANTDTLTGLPNRSYFQVSHSNLVRKRIQHALLVFDLDDFKKINDSLGHEAGDTLLCQVAERLAEVGRPQDTLYRLGGDEFSLILEDTSDLTVITQTAKRVNDALAAPFSSNDGELVISSSVGIVVYPNDGNSSQELLQNADTAMYHAKRLGGNGYQFFSESMNQSAVRRLRLEYQLRQALRDHDVEVHYQPKVSLISKKFIGLEALVRLNLPGAGIISPAEFIPLAEETGLIFELGELVLRHACRDMKHWLEQGVVSGRVAVNLSAKQFNQPDLARRIDDIMQSEGLSPEHLELEITEGVVMNDPEHAIEIMSELNQAGIHLALDDFGTGYSSLSYLKQFPIQTLKIDKAFIDDITESDKDRNMVASIVGMAHNLGLNVVAEGVETREQMMILSALKCEIGQGYLFSKPLPAPNLRERLTQQPAIA